jgi:hypothetical protein
MRRTTVAPLAAALALGALVVTATPALAQIANVANRPAVLIETDYYVYGPSISGFDVPDVNLSIDANGYSDAVTLYMFWENRQSNQRLYFNASTGFSGTERDVLSVGNTPAPIFVPDLADFQLFGDDGAFGPLPNAVPSTVGRYQFVVELRDASGSNVIARSNAMYNQVADFVQVSGNINGGNWDSDNAYYLAAPVNVVSGNLAIEAGTMILGSRAGQGVLVVRPGATINAAGTAKLPIVFGSEETVGSRAPGDWGGLVISGNAPVNTGMPEGEGDSGVYGGDNPADSSGRLSYVRVEYAGIRFSEENELNGIAFQGVGNGTQIDHIQVHHNQDDGIEFFGGTANAKYLLVTDARDDSLDWTDGWNGKVQHVVVIQRDPSSNNGIEADNFEGNNDLEPRSNPTIYNATFIGNRNIANFQEGGAGALLRRGTAGTYRNFIWFNFAELGVEVDGAVSQGLVGTELTIDNSIINNNADGASNIQDYLQGQSVSFASPQLRDPQSPLRPDVTFSNGSPARNSGGLVAQPPNDGFFDGVNYLGGVNPNDPWIWEEWTTFSDN